MAGLITGFLISLKYKTPEYRKPILYDWQDPNFNHEEDAFMKHFDEQGNFVNLPEPEEIIVERESFFTSNLNVVYDFVEDHNVTKTEKN